MGTKKGFLQGKTKLENIILRSPDQYSEICKYSQYSVRFGICDIKKKFM